MSNIVEPIIKPIMTAEIARKLALEKKLNLYKNSELIKEYTELINNRIKESVIKGKTSYGFDEFDFVTKFYGIEQKYESVWNIVEDEFKKQGYIFYYHADKFSW